MYECKCCGEDLEEFVCYNNLLSKELECPGCKAKFELGYDESFDGENETTRWWIEQ